MSPLVTKHLIAFLIGLVLALLILVLVYRRAALRAPEPCPVIQSVQWLSPNIQTTLF